MRVLIVAPFAHHVVCPADRSHRFGGTEVRAVTFARLLAARGLDVRLGVSAAHARVPATVAGVPTRVGMPARGPFHAWQAAAKAQLPRDENGRWSWRPGPLAAPVALGARMVDVAARRLRPPAPPEVNFHLGHVDAAVVFGTHPFCAGAVRGLRASPRTFIAYALVNDTDLSDDDQQTRAVDKRRVLDEVDELWAQTSAQVDQAARRGHRAALVPNPPPDLGLPDATPPDGPPYVLWVGRDTRQKRLDHALDLAARCPAIAFRVIVDGGPTEARAVPANVSLHPGLDFATTAAWVRGARLLVNTSDHEGFPNTFLQAAAAGVPIISLRVDPASMLATGGAGACGHGDLADTARLLQQHWDDDRVRAAAAASARRFLDAHHDPDRIADAAVARLQHGRAAKESAAAAFRTRTGEEPRTSRAYYARRELAAAYARQVPRALTGRSDLTVLDYGAGNSPYRPLLAPYLGTYLRADIDPGGDVPLLPDGRIDRAAASVDVVLSSQVLEHVPDPAAYLQEARRVLRPGGTLLLSTHGMWPHHPDPQDLWRWTTDGLCTLFEQNQFVVDDIEAIQGMAATGVQLVQDALAPRLPGRLRPLLYAPAQLAMQLLDAATPARLLHHNAAVFLVTAHPSESP